MSAFIHALERLRRALTFKENFVTVNKNDLHQLMQDWERLDANMRRQAERDLSYVTLTDTPVDPNCRTYGELINSGELEPRKVVFTVRQPGEIHQVNIEATVDYDQPVCSKCGVPSSHCDCELRQQYLDETAQGAKS